MGGDCEFLLRVLWDGEEHELEEILALSRAERGYGLTVHSRASELRKRGYVVVNHVERPEGGRARSFYRLAELEEAAVPSPALSPRARWSLSRCRRLPPRWVA